MQYEDDWYVVSWRPDEYAFIYYRGRNDAWSGYGGEPQLPFEMLLEFQAMQYVVSDRSLRKSTKPFLINSRTPLLHSVVGTQTPGKAVPSVVPAVLPAAHQ